MNRQNTSNKTISTHLSTVLIACAVICNLSLHPTQFASAQATPSAGGERNSDLNKVSSWPILTNETIVLLKGALQDRNREVRALSAEVARLKMLLKASSAANKSTAMTFSKSMRAEFEQNLSEVRAELNATQRELVVIKGEHGKKNKISKNLK